MSIQVNERDNSPLAVVLVAGALLAVVAAVLYLWWQVAPQPPRSSERFYSAVHGAALGYRITNPDGSTTYMSRNVYRQNANAVSSKMDLNSFGAMVRATGLDWENLDPAVLSTYLGQYDIVQRTDVRTDARGTAQPPTTLRALLMHDSFEQFAVDQIGISPPIPLIPSAPETLEGKLNDSVPYTMTQQIDERGPYSTALGDFSDCVRVRAELTVDTIFTTSRTWYCAGVGEVADETTDASGTRRSEIVSASVGPFLRGSTPLLPDPNVNASLQRVFPDPLQNPVAPQLAYKERAESQGITTNILAVNGTLLYGTKSGALVALDRLTGQELWRFQTGDAIFSTPVVANGIAYFGSADKKVYAVRVADGAFVWAFQTRDNVTASPAADRGTIYVASEDRTLYALDADTGRPRWNFSSGSPVVAPPVIDGERIYVSNDDGGLFALNTTTGAQVWEFGAGGAITAPVAIDGDTLYFGSYDQSVYALNKADGKLVWTRDVGDNVQEAVGVQDGRVYVTLPEEVFALGQANGNLLWRYDNGRTLYGAALVLGDQLWLSQSGSIFALDAQTGSRLQQVPTSEAGVFTGLSSDGQELFAPFYNGELLSFRGAAQ